MIASKSGRKDVAGHRIYPQRTERWITARRRAYGRSGWRSSIPLACWERLEDVTPLRDRAVDEPITARSVIIQRVTQEIVYGDPGPAGNPRRFQHLVGSGQVGDRPE